jgi:DNA polymerase-1
VDAAADVLAAMEQKGAPIDSSFYEMSGYPIIPAQSEEDLHTAGERLTSIAQVLQVIPDKLKLAKDETKEGYSTDVDVLTALAQTNELPAEILAYRSISKLKSTYVDALPTMVHPQTGRIHTSYNQTVTATGRLSSSNPNLQNIPIRTSEGRRIRQAFIAPEGYALVRRLLPDRAARAAHLSGDGSDRGLEGGEDIHLHRPALGVFLRWSALIAQAGQGHQLRRHLR